MKHASASCRARIAMLALNGVALLSTSACATVPLADPPGPATPASRTDGTPAVTSPAPSVTTAQLVERMMIFITPVNQNVDVDFCALNNVITRRRDRAIIEGRASAADGWRRWARSERTEIVQWLGGNNDLVSRVTIWVRQPAGDVNANEDGDMPAGTPRFHLSAHPSSRLYEGAADAYRDELIEPPGLAPIARAWFYTGTPDNDKLPVSRGGFKGLDTRGVRDKFDRDFLAIFGTSRGNMFGPSSRVALGLDKSTPHGSDSAVYAIARDLGGPVMYEPLGEPGNPWIADPSWTGLILEDTFWDWLGTKSKWAQPRDVAGPIARFMSRPMNLTPREKWRRFCAMVQGRAYEGRGAKGEWTSDEGDEQVYQPVVALYFLKNEEWGLLKGYNDWRVQEKGLAPVSAGYFDDAANVARAVSEFDGPYKEQEGRKGTRRRDLAREAAEHAKQERATPRSQE